MIPTRADVLGWDAADPIGSFRKRFALPDGIIYLDGNSLGALPMHTPARVAATIEQEWGQGLIRSWNDAGWIDAPTRVGAKLAQLVGAEPHEVLVADSTSVNLFKLLSAALEARPGRTVILSEPGNFPTDLYVAEGVATFRPGTELRLVAREGIIDALDERVAVVMLTHVHYKSAARFDMAALTRAAQAAGALILWDLSHSAGAVPIDLNTANVDLAVGCGYKYLNGGPGAPAFLFIAERHQALLRSPLSGWMGHQAPFAFDDGYAPSDGIRRFLCGTPPILGLAALESGLDLMLEADRPALFDKARRLTELFIALVEAWCPDLQLVTPRAWNTRGSHVSFAHPHGYEIMQALIARGVIGDFRAPDILRFGFTPLYVSFEDVWRAGETLRDIMETQAWRDPKFAERGFVT